MSPLFPLVSLMIPAILSDPHVSYEHQAPMSLLRDLILGEVIPCCGPRYDQLRSVNNRACVSRKVNQETSVHWNSLIIFQARGYREAGNYRGCGHRCQLCQEKWAQGLCFKNFFSS